ncbi:FACT complex subunit Ssrp1 isoform X1 [Zootermopsis nevadensis]|uniref:FACT complex subunit SSRP1 n=2 Tax=Zootermopsis nevadensis TaxID=136037 RepID=A0A067R232_ZOONE|nr:FACT complex subunit Ssrp1 isoform X1 [Zootermopsis nevadensis]KDR11732.1 FACT complex subunit Ssrp1 [Zootermopsis nevadensis]
MDFLEYSDISAEVKGAMCPGRLKLTDQHIIFKNSKTGKVEQITASDLDIVNWQRLVGTWGIRIFLKNGTLHRFGGFKEGEQEKIAKFFSSNYNKEMLEKELSLKGWNWGTARFNGAVLSFDVGSNTALEVPLNHVSQCTTGKNEVTLEFHQNDDAPVSLMEMRFHIPSSELAGDVDPVEAFHQQVMKQASVINLSGDAITTFKEIQCLTPRGRYDIKIFQSFFQLHGKTFDYKIPMSTVLRLFILPHKDSRQMFFVVSLDPPIKQGQTRYHYLVFLFGQEEDITIELSITDEEVKEKYDGKLSKEITGPTYEVLGKVMKAIVNRKITVPGGFVGHSGTPAVGCSYKAAAGYMYPLERGFIYVHKPPVHIRFEEINSVNFARSGGGTRSFDFEVETKSGVVHTFSSIEKDEYGKLFDFITSKKLRVKNRGKSDKPSYADDFGDSDHEDEPDAYLARVKAEAEERDEGDGAESEDESTDEDFNPDQQESDVAEEYDSNPTPSDSDEGSGDSEHEKNKKKVEKKERKPKKTKTVSEKPRKKHVKQDKDENKPKRPPTAFMLYLNANREKIKSENPGIVVTDIAKKGGEMWRDLKDKSEWENKASKLKEEYAKAMKEYEASGGGGSESKDKKKETKKKESTPKSVPPKSGSFKSKEYISDVESSSSSEKADDEGGKGKKPSRKPPPAKKAKMEEVKKDAETKIKKEKKASDDEPLDQKKKSAPAKTVKQEKESDDDIDEPIEKTPPTSEDEVSGSESDSD